MTGGTFAWRLIFVAAVSIQLSTSAVSQPAKPAPPQSAPGDPWKARLEALRPDRPDAYFELAEELADVATTEEQKAMARRLFALAGVLDSRRLGRSACLALADLETNPQQKKRLLALAALLDPSGASAASVPGITPRPAEAIDNAAALAVCEAISRYRRGQGTQALASLKKPGAMGLLEAHASIIPGGLPRFLEDCKQMRGVKPNLTEDDITRLLRLESLLLTGADRTWTTELSVQGKGPPLLEIDPDHLSVTFNIDASRPVYRNGRWVEK